MSKTLLCPCEDVTETEIAHAIAKGFRDIESVKRYTGFGTGMCQGKQCQVAVARFLRTHGDPQAPQKPFTSRPPYVATELRGWASLPLDPEAPIPTGVPPQHSLSSAAGAELEPLPTHADVVIIGAGILGLSLAYNLALRGAQRVAVLDESYLCAGASGRNGGGVRAQWGTKNLIELAARSIELMKRFAQDTGINVWFRQGGYLLLAKSERFADRLMKSTEIQRGMGIRTEILTPQQAQQHVPEMDLEGVRLGAHNPNDGVIFPWPLLWGYAQEARKRGATVSNFTSVQGFSVSEGMVRVVRTNRGDISCDRVVLAAGAWSPKIAAMAGVQLPNVPKRHEICSTEPLKPFLKPLVSVLDSGLYFSQSLRGEIVGGLGDPEEPPGINLASSARFLIRYARALTSLMPQVATVKVLRQWSGPYDTTPDNLPVLGAAPELPNLFHLSGFVGYGLMMAPAIGERMASWMVEGSADELFDRYSVERFASGSLEPEELVIG